MTRNAISLDDKQLKLVQQAARLVPPEVRDWFLTRVANHLSSKPHPTDRDVQRALTDTLTSVHVAVPISLTLE
jgi:hypothetical protein